MRKTDEEGAAETRQGRPGTWSSSSVGGSTDAARSVSGFSYTFWNKSNDVCRVSLIFSRILSTSTAASLAWLSDKLSDLLLLGGVNLAFDLIHRLLRARAHGVRLVRLPIRPLCALSVSAYCSASDTMHSMSLSERPDRMRLLWTSPCWSPCPWQRLR